MIHRVTLYGEPVLRRTTRPVENFDANFQKTVEDMVETMRAADGIGLAAPQINLDCSLCIVDVSLLAEPGSRVFHDEREVPLDVLMPLALANPRIVDQSPERGLYREGCLSIPDIHLDVVRPLAVRVEYEDTAGITHQLFADGIFARCLQHEIDHLNGVLFVDRIPAAQLAGVRNRLKKLQRASRDLLKTAAKNPA